MGICKAPNPRNVKSIKPLWVELAWINIYYALLLASRFSFASYGQHRVSPFNLELVMNQNSKQFSPRELLPLLRAVTSSQTALRWGLKSFFKKDTCCPILFLAPYPLLHELRHKSCLEYPFLYQFSTVSSLVMVLKPPDPDGQNTNGDQLSIQEINDGKDYLFTGKVKGKLIQKYSL